MQLLVSLPEISKNVINSKIFDFRIESVNNNQYKKVENEYTKSKFITTICLSCASQPLFSEVFKILSPSELIKFNSFSSEKRKLHFLLGRYSAKKAAIFNITTRNTTNNTCHKTVQLSMQDINICAGIFGQPIFENFAIDLDLSISHSGLYGGACVFDRKCSIGFDLQHTDESKRKVLEKYTSYNEIQSDLLIDLTAAWSFKEALTKALRCGLTMSKKILTIKNFQKNYDKISCEFLYFPQYSGSACLLNEMIVAMVFPKF